MTAERVGRQTRIALRLRNKVRSRGMSLRLCAGVIGLSVALISPAAAQEPFYKGKRLTLVINFAPGGPSDIEGRLLAKHIVKHIDGQPLVIVQNKDGAGGLVGTNFLGEVGPRDGT